MSEPYRCNYCGAPSWVHPQDQRPPPSYCHESDHGEPDELISLAQPRTDAYARAFRGMRDQTMHLHLSEVRTAVERATGMRLGELGPLELMNAVRASGHVVTTAKHLNGTEEVFVDGRLAVTFGPVVLTQNEDGSVSATRRVKRERAEVVHVGGPKP